MKENVLAALKDKKYRGLAIFAGVLALLGIYFILLFHHYLMQQPSDFCSAVSPTSDSYDYYHLCDLSSINNLNGLAGWSGVAAAAVLLPSLALVWLFCVRVLPRIANNNEAQTTRPIVSFLGLALAVVVFGAYAVNIDNWVFSGVGFFGFLPLVGSFLLLFLSVGWFVVVPKALEIEPLPLASPRTLSTEEQKQYEQALQAVQFNPQSFEAWANLGYTQHRLDKNEDALASANKALSLNKRYARAWMVRGAALSTMEGQEDKALEALERALIEDPNDIDALFYKAQVFVFQGNDYAAHAILDRVLALNPRHREALIIKGTAYLAIENYNEVLVTAEKLTSRFPDDDAGWIMQGLAYGLPGEKEGVPPKTAYALLNKALASFDMAIEIDPQDSRAYLLKASSYIALGDNSRALQTLNQGLAISPNDPELQKLKMDIINERTKKVAKRVAGIAGRVALGVGIGLVKAHVNVVKTVLRDDFRKP